MQAVAKSGPVLPKLGAASDLETDVAPSRKLSEGQRAYEAKRAAKAGMSLERWLDMKERQQQAEARKQPRAEAPKPAKPPGFFARLIERAQKPL
jgi:hypothetical protein